MAKMEKPKVNPAVASYARIKGISLEEAEFRLQTRASKRAVEEEERLSPAARIALELFGDCDRVDAMPPGENQQQLMGKIVKRVEAYSESYGYEERVKAQKTALRILERRQESAHRGNGTVGKQA